MVHIVIISVDYSNARKVCEQIENQTFETKIELINTLNDLLINEYDDEKVTVEEISDFMDLINDQILDNLTNDFISYVNIIHN